MLYRELFEKKEAVLSSVYPEFSLPADEKTLKMLFSIFNRLYFASKLPRPKFAFTDADKHSGITKVKSEGTKISNYRLYINKKIRNNRKAVVDVFLHELIHVWQYMMVNNTGKTEYVDPKRISKIKGHGTYFWQQANILNGKGFDIKTDSDAIDLEIPLTYCIAAVTKSNQIAILTSTENFHKKPDVVVNSLVNFAGQGTFNAYTLFTTTDTLSIGIPKLTKAGKLPKNARHIYILPKVVDELLASKKTKITHAAKEITPSTDSALTDIPQDVLSMLPRIQKKVRSRPFKEYLRMLVQNVSYKDSISVPFDYQYGDEIDGLPNKIIEFVYNNWKKVELSEIKSSYGVKQVVSGIDRFMYGTSSVNNLIGEFNEYYDDRISEKDFAKIVFDKAVLSIAAKLKKTPHAYSQFFIDNQDKKFIIATLKDKFKGTALV